MKRALFMVAVAGCATLGAESAFPDPLQTSGAGPFRVLEEIETGVGGLPGGRVLDQPAGSGGGMVAGDFLFYVQAEPLETTPERDASLPPTEVDWAQYQPRRIYRTAARNDDLGFDLGDEALVPSEAFESEGVFDPWVVQLDDGRARMYYATAEGIAIAEASSLDGSFARVAGPFFAGARSPSVVRFQDAWVMLHEMDGALALARSSDGLTFDAAISLDVRFVPEDGPAEVAYGRPGALVATSPVGRTVLRVYFQIHYEDGTQQVSLAATEDGTTFERLAGTVFADPTAGAPAPRLLEDGTTLLYMTLAKELPGGDVQARAIVGAVAPAFVRFAEEMPEDE